MIKYFLGCTHGNAVIDITLGCGTIPTFGEMVGICLQVYMVSQPRRTILTSSLL
jgi:hypothetical protein